MSYPPAYKNDISMNPKPTKKAAAVKRKTVTPKSQNVADFRATLRTAMGAIASLDLLIDRMIKDKQ